MSKLGFKVDGCEPGGAARACTITTSRGTIHTPIFMPVGTQGSVKGLGPDELRAMGAEIILGNTYHLYLRPGTAVLERFGGLHNFSTWDRPILTDSGGYQFFSLSQFAKFDDHGVEFRSHIDGSKHLFTPEKAIEVQAVIGSDIMMVLDQCPALPATRQTLEAAVKRTTHWAVRSLEAAKGVPGAVFAIAQGGTDIELRLEHIAELASHPFDGLALGGFAVGEAPEDMYRALAQVAQHMPTDRPRYLMGVGRPEDILEAIRHGIDMFDCVMPTRNARNAQVFTRTGKINLRNARFATDTAPIDERCTCVACKTCSRGYLHHLLRVKEILGARLATIHNVHYWLDVVRGAREAILCGRFEEYRRESRAGWQLDPEPDSGG